MTKTTSLEHQSTEHAFAQYVRILGKGKSGTRDLTQAEAENALSMILNGEVEPVQLGAFLMLLRVKEESGAELAGFVQACRSSMPRAPSTLVADLDWSSYAGKKHQHPWFILSILLLTQAGYRVFIHGTRGHTTGRLYTEDALLAMGLPVAGDWADVEQQLDTTGMSYLPLQHLCPELDTLIQLRPLLGLRSPVHTLVRMFNPLLAPASIQSIFHPAYGTLHQQADSILKQPNALVFKGESGEVEIKPHADTRLMFLCEGTMSETPLKRTITERVASVAQPAVEPLQQLWCTGSADKYGLETVLATTAVALRLLDQGRTREGSQTLARELWESREINRLAACP
ncbi:MAG: glycosyl transferase family protein [Halioglobus sp.]